MSDKTPGELIAEKIVTLGEANSFDHSGIWIMGGFSNGNFWFQTPNGATETARAIRFAFRNAIDAAIAAEREACAKLVEQDPNTCATCGLSTPDHRAKYLAEAIRARNSA